MADVARKAGVSLMTVSRVVNNKGDVSSETREAVQAAIEQLGYRPSLIARGLVTKRTATLGLVIPDNANPFFSEVARAAEHVAYAEGYNVFLCNTEEDLQRELAVLQSLEEKQVDGIVLCSSRLDDEKLREMIGRFPAAVLVNRRLNNGATGTILVDDEMGGRIATRHLLQAGHRAIGFLAGPAASQSGVQRAAGYHTVLQNATITINPQWIKHCAPTVDGGREAARELLINQPELTALYCYNDLVAVGALQACTELERDVPNDIAVMGCDDTMLAALVTPPLSTCRVSRHELGTQAMQLLLNQINGCRDECGEIVLQPVLVIRASAP
jgi:LacI family transcriptional regulator